MRELPALQMLPLHLQESRRTSGVKLRQPSRVAEQHQAAAKGLLAPAQTGQQLRCHLISIRLRQRVVLVKHAALKPRLPQRLPIQPRYGRDADMRQRPFVLPLPISPLNLFALDCTVCGVWNT